MLKLSKFMLVIAKKPIFTYVILFVYVCLIVIFFCVIIHAIEYLFSYRLPSALNDAILLCVVICIGFNYINKYDKIRQQIIDKLKKYINLS